MNYYTIDSLFRYGYMAYDYEYSSNRVALDDKVALTTELEGGYGAPEAQMIACLQDILCCKYSLYIAYRSFADRVRGPWRDALVDHWHDHSKEEKQAAYDVAMKIVGLGGDPCVTQISIPQCPPDVTALSICLAKMELNVIQICRELIECSGDNTAMRVFAENMVLTDTQHLDDLRRMTEHYVG
jgi:bacterioferritin (cytochrome b1)